MSAAFAVAATVFAASGAAAAFFVGEYLELVAAPEPPVRVYLAALPKTLLFLTGLTFAWRNARRFEPGNPARPAWALLAGGLLGFSLGQLGLDYYQFRYGQAPFPSVGDLFFVLGYPFFLGALIAFVRAYRAAGFPLGAAWEHVTIVSVLAVACAGLGYVVLKPLMDQPAPALELALNLGYPISDLVLLLPTAVLLRIALGFRGGAVWPVWLTLLAGFVFMSAGDVLFAYEYSFDQGYLNPLVHATFILSYGLVALGAVLQNRLLEA